MNHSSGEVAMQGADASSVLQWAIDALERTGGVIYVRSGIYENISLRMDKNAITLIGEGWDGAYPYENLGTVFRGNEQTKAPIINISRPDQRRVDGFAIRGISFDGTGAPGNAGLDVVGIYANVTTRLTIDSCKFYALRQEAIDVFSSYGLVIQDCLVSHCGSSTALGDSQNYSAVRISGSNDALLSTAVRIDRTQIVYSKWIGLDSAFIGDTCIVSKCYFDSGQRPDGSWIPTQSQVRSQGIISIENGVFYNAGMYVVELYGAHCKLTDSYIMLHPTTGGKAGIYTNGGRDMMITDNTISGGEVHGMLLGGLQSSIIQNNIVSYAGDSGIFMAFCDNVTISNNIIKNNGRLSNDSFGSGLALWGTSHCMITNNRCSDDQSNRTQMSGLVEDGPSDHNLIMNNDFRNNVEDSTIHGTNTICFNNQGLIAPSQSVTSPTRTTKCL